MSDTFSYKKVLILGATSGIGRALAEKILNHSNAKVVVTGRRQDRLDDFASQHEAGGRVSTAVVDVTDLKALPGVLEKMLAEHDDIDFVMHNSGILRQIDFTDPASLDLATAETELTTNYISILHVLKHVLPHLLSKSDGSVAGQKNAAFASVTSQLGVFPLLGCANYCATKAAAHQLMISLRGQMRDKNVKIIEISPTGVQTELLTPGQEPEKKNEHMMPLEEYATGVWDKLSAGEEFICVGTAPEMDELEAIRSKIFKQWNGLQ